MIRDIHHRIYSDFLLPSRMETYRDILLLALGQGYQTHSLESFWALVQAQAVSKDEKYLILRHDIDTDPMGAREMFEIEKSHQVKSSFYFRLSTLDISLMQEIAAFGSEASYHYEEIATYAKKHRIRDPAQVRSALPQIRTMFAKNIERLRGLTGLPMTIVASHGDFANRRLNIKNWELLTSAEFRKTVGIELESYDDAINRYVMSRHSDDQYPNFWIPSSPLDALREQKSVVYLLTHPRHWRCARIVNLKDDLWRAWEGLRYL